MSSAILHRQLRAPLPEVAGGQGAWLVDRQGKRYLDGSCGAAVSCLGHAHPKVIAAIKAQLERIAFAHSAFLTNAPAEELAARLSARAPGGPWRVLLVSGGSEAIEAALKLACQIHLERGEGTRARFIARAQSYHGATLATLALGGHWARKAPYRGLLGEDGALLGGAMHHIPPCYEYRHRRPEETGEEYGHRAARALAEKLAQLGPETVAAFVAETVVGATLGAVPPAPGYFREIRRICDEAGILLILDEVMCGMGRTGTLFACEQEGIIPDMIVIAKGLGGGYQPIGAVLVREELANAISEGSGLLRQGHTYMAHATAAAAALAVLEVIEEDGLLARVAEGGRGLKALLRERFGQHPYVGDIRGRGFFVGVELVGSREDKTPFPRALGLAARIKRRAMANGLICYPENGTADGHDGDHVLLAPPFIISDDELELLVARLSKSIDQSIDEAMAAAAACGKP